MPKPSMLGPKSGRAVPGGHAGKKKATPSAETVAPTPRRRTFSPAEKLRIVQEAAKCKERGESVEAFLRREGVYSSHLSMWRRQLNLHGSEGLAAGRPGRKPKLDAKDRRIQQVEKENERLRRRLEVADKLLELQKKASELLGVTLPKLNDEED